MSTKVDPQLAVLAWLATKPRPRIVGRMCQSEQRTCRRPVWGDGRVDGEFYGMCSRCWHEHNAFHGHYVTMQVNPAAARLTADNISRLTFNRLPDIGAHQPDTYPESWNT